MRLPVRPLLFALSVAALAASSIAQDTATMGGLRWRSIGPFRGGRVSSVTGAVGMPGTFYMGMPQGGIWKTTSNGQTWYPVADSIKEVSCFGSVQVAPSNPNIVYAGSGEAIGGEGDGVYKTEDGGQSWVHLPGLEESKQIPSILVDPHDPEIALLASLGSDRIRTKERGVYRTTNGGKSWNRTLFIDDETGVMHLAWAYDNPNVVFAVSSKHFGSPLNIGGVGPAQPAQPTATIYKSGDEGATWKKLDAKGSRRSSDALALRLRTRPDPKGFTSLGNTAFTGPTTAAPIGARCRRMIPHRKWPRRLLLRSVRGSKEPGHPLHGCDMRVQVP